MATYSDFISLLRQDTNDFPVRRFESADSDGATLIYQLQNPKIYEGSLTVKVNSVAKVENTDYTVDYDVGQIIFNTAPPSGNDNVTFTYKSVFARDTDWIDMVNQCLLYSRKKLWIEFINQTDPTLQTIIDKVDYPLSAIANDVLDIINIEYQTSAIAPWQSVRGFTNVIFYRDLQELHIRPPFSVSGYQMRIRGIRAYALGNTTASTFELQNKFWPVIRKYVEALYWERRATLIARETGALSKESIFEGMDQLKKLAQGLRQEADTMMKQVKVPRPPKSIPTNLFGVKI